MAGSGLRHVGWHVIEGRRDLFEPMFESMADGDAHEISYEEFMGEYLQYTIRETYRAMQKAAISLRSNLNAISDEVLAVTDPELLQTLTVLAVGDYRFAYWVFNCPPQFSINRQAQEITISQTNFSEEQFPKKKNKGRLKLVLDRAADMPIAAQDATIIQLTDPAQIKKAQKVVGELRENVEQSANAIAEFVRRYWKIQDLI